MITQQAHGSQNSLCSLSWGQRLTGKADWPGTNLLCNCVVGHHKKDLWLRSLRPRNCKYFPVLSFVKSRADRYRYGLPSHYTFWRQTSAASQIVPGILDILRVISPIYHRHRFAREVLTSLISKKIFKMISWLCICTLTCIINIISYPIISSCQDRVAQCWYFNVAQAQYWNISVAARVTEKFSLPRADGG